VNIIEKIETGCVTIDTAEQPNLQNICRRLDPKQQIITMFAENYTPINCRSSLEGVFHFSYQVRIWILFRMAIGSIFSFIFFCGKTIFRGISPSNLA
jgi:hypothetical protein